MWHGVPFACQRHPIIGVLRMCWLLPGSFDWFCCPSASVHRPSIACLAVFLCGPGALFLHALSGPSTICPFPPHGWSAPDGLPLLLHKQPIWAAGDTPHLMPVEQGLPWDPVAAGLAGQAILFVVAASHLALVPACCISFTPKWTCMGGVGASAVRAMGCTRHTPTSAHERAKIVKQPCGLCHTGAFTRGGGSDSHEGQRIHPLIVPPQSHECNGLCKQ